MTMAYDAHDLITRERREHKRKHGFDQQHDAQWKNGELYRAAAIVQRGKLNKGEKWPLDPQWKDKALAKTEAERLAIAAALLEAERDRIAALVISTRKELDKVLKTDPKVKRMPRG